MADVLADTGADISILPRTIGELVINEIKEGKYLEIRGITPGAYTEVFIHDLTCKIGPVRFKGLDLFEAVFYKGKETRL